MPSLSAPAKLTLSLRITGVRPDGYHLIDAEMVTIDLRDTIDIDVHGDGLEVVDGEGRPVTDLGPVADNLVTRALRLVGRTAGVRVLKRIPHGAGLGGGSADAAAVLRWAGHDDLVEAAQLGADVTFCVVGGRARVNGIGELVTRLPFRDLTFTLSTPPVRCPTPAVYAAWDALGGPQGSGDNDLEVAALAVAPELGRWRDELGDATGLQPRLAGSGSTWFVAGQHPGPGRIVVSTVPSH